MPSAELCSVPLLLPRQLLSQTALNLCAEAGAGRFDLTALPRRIVAQQAAADSARRVAPA